MSEEESQLTAYAVRLSPRALREAAIEMQRIDEAQGEDVAREWYIGLFTAAGTLSQQPRRYASLRDASRWMGRDVRRLLYRRTPNSAAYLMLYTILDEGEDGPRVIVFHVRHAASKPLTAREARELREGL